jgi:hypothetical protein
MLGQHLSCLRIRRELLDLGNHLVNRRHLRKAHGEHGQHDLLDLGVVVGLDYQNPFTDPHQLFQQFKLHPAIAKMLEGGRMLHYGAKAIPEGGYFSQPKYYGDGFLIIGDSASFLNSRLASMTVVLPSSLKK